MVYTHNTSPFTLKEDVWEIALLLEVRSTRFSRYERDKFLCYLGNFSCLLFATHSTLLLTQQFIRRWDGARLTVRRSWQSIPRLCFDAEIQAEIGA